MTTTTRPMLAALIEADVKERGTAPGQLIGREAELCGRYGVGVARLRQAVRVLEARGVAQMRRGAGGGLFVAAPTLFEAINYLGAQCESAGAPLDEFVSGVEIVASVLYRRASERMTVDGARKLRELMAACRSARGSSDSNLKAAQREYALARITGNPFITLAHIVGVRFLTNAMPFDLRWDDSTSRNWPLDSMETILTHIIEGDPEAARRHLRVMMQRMTGHLEHWQAEHAGAGPSLPAGRDLVARPVMLARHMLREIREARRAPGEYLGSEAELIVRYGVSRSTWREAMQVLQEYQAVECRRGRAGGVYVGAPDGEIAGRVAHDWLVARGATLAQALDVAGPLAMQRVGLLCEAGAGGVAHSSLSEILADIGRRSGCPFLSFLIPEIDALMQAAAVDDAVPPGLFAEWSAAVADRDAPLARRALAEMLAAASESRQAPRRGQEAARGADLARGKQKKHKEEVMSRGALMMSAALACAALSAGDAAAADRSYDAPAGRCSVAAIQAMVPGATIEAAASVAAPAPHCRIDGYVTTANPGPNKVSFRLQLPDTGFNGRYIMAGLGGAAGYVPTDMQIPSGNPVVKGFAMAGTDTGHRGEMLDWSFIRDNPAQSLDYGHRGVHVTALATQKITRDYYGAPKLYRYISGCSGGGRMGKEAVEHHPEDFDGVLIGAPGRSTATMLMFMWATTQMAREPGAWLSPAKLGMVEQKITAHCDAIDGAKDGVVWNPAKCDFKPDTLQCAGADAADCLTAAELKTFKAVLDGPRYPDGTRITGGMPITNVGTGWPAFLGATPPPWVESISLKDIAKTNSAAIMGHVMSKAYFGPEFNYFTDFDWSDQKQFDAWWAAAKRVGFGLPSPGDWRKAETAGTKVIWWHGVSDAGPTLDTTHAYFADIKKHLGDSQARVDRMAKVYEVPGMLHCGSGAGPDDVPDQLLLTLIDWTEKGVTPGPVVTGRGPSKADHVFITQSASTTSGVLIPTSKGADRDFLLCPLPQVATFNGKAGGEGDAANWSCKTS